MNIKTLRKQHTDILGRAERMRESIVTQLSTLIDDADVSLGVPIESRVKQWSSIEEKFERKSLEIDDLNSLQDLVGVRAILLFRTDLERVDALIHETFDIVSSEDTSKRLDETQFGYQSLHYVVKVPASWLTVPNMADFHDLQTEIQVRTLAQHIWAAASHKLQYKDEASVPPPVKRAINRASALLETVDLEFERVLEARQHYRETEVPARSGSETLNVDLLTTILNEILPAQNRKDDDKSEALLQNLTALSINTATQLEVLLRKHLKAVLKDDETRVREIRNGNIRFEKSLERTARGVFFSHVGLARQALRKEFGEERIHALLSN